MTKAARNQAVIDRILDTCVRDLFAHYGALLHPVTAAVGPHDFIAIIGFHGQTVRGVLGIGADRNVVSKMLDGTPHDPDLAEDCALEAANQLLGRVKNKLLRYGVVLVIGLPIPLRGVDLNFAEGGVVVPHRYLTPEGGITAWFDARVRSDVVLETGEEAGSLASGEGELRLF